LQHVGLCCNAVLCRSGVVAKRARRAPVRTTCAERGDRRAIGSACWQRLGAASPMFRRHPSANESNRERRGRRQSTFQKRNCRTPKPSSARACTHARAQPPLQTIHTQRHTHTHSCTRAHARALRPTQRRTHRCVRSRRGHSLVSSVARHRHTRAQTCTRSHMRAQRYPYARACAHALAHIHTFAHARSHSRTHARSHARAHLTLHTHRTHHTSHT
jgi:hypothetical protein